MPALKPATIGQKLLTDCGQNRPLTTVKACILVIYGHQYLFPYAQSSHTPLACEDMRTFFRRLSNIISGFSSFYYRPYSTLLSYFISINQSSKSPGEAHKSYICAISAIKKTLHISVKCLVNSFVCSVRDFIALRTVVLYELL